MEGPLLKTVWHIVFLYSIPKKEGLDNYFLMGDDKSELWRGR